MGIKDTVSYELSEASVHGGSDRSMALLGVAKRAAILMLCMVATAVLTWSLSFRSTDLGLVVTITGFLIVLLTVATMRNIGWAPVTSPILASSAGFLIGTHTYAPTGDSSELVLLLGLSFGPLIVLLGAYAFGLVQANQKLRLGLVSAVGGPLLTYLIALALPLAGVRLPAIDAIFLVPMMIVVLAPVVIFVHRFLASKGSAEAGAPRFMEWYDAFWLLVTGLLVYVVLFRLFFDPLLSPFIWYETY